MKDGSKKGGTEVAVSTSLCVTGEDWVLNLAEMRQGEEEGLNGFVLLLRREEGGCVEGLAVSRAGGAGISLGTGGVREKGNS